MNTPMKLTILLFVILNTMVATLAQHPVKPQKLVEQGIAI